MLLLTRIGQVLDELDEIFAPHLYPPREDGTDPRVCQVCGTGRLSLRLGKFGAFIGCSNYPECKNTRPSVGQSAGQVAGCTSLARIRKPVLSPLRVGRFGPYCNRRRHR